MFSFGYTKMFIYIIFNITQVSDLEYFDEK